MKADKNTLAHVKQSSQNTGPKKKNSADNAQWGISFVLAVSVHVLLFLGLFFVFQWNRVSDEVVYAELWAPGQLAAPAPQPTENKPSQTEDLKTEDSPEPEPQPESPPTQPTNDQKDVEQPLEQDVIRQQDEQKKLEELKRLEEQKKLEEQKRLEEQKKLEEQKRLEEQKKLEEQKRVEQKKLLDAKKRLEEQKRQEQRRREQAKLLAQQLQQQEMQRLEQTSQNNAAGIAATTGGGAQSAVYNSRVVSCVRRNLIFSVTPDMKSGQYKTVYEVTLLENGQQSAAPKLIKASGLPAFDRQVEAAIRKCDPFPIPNSGKAPKTIVLTFDPVETKK